MPDDTILVVGATGFTGKLVLQRLASHPDRKSYALQAGARSPSKLAATIADLDIEPALRGGIESVTFDTSNYADVERAVLGATIVIACAGPFHLYGSNVLAACARNGRHYVDISGENFWFHKMIKLYDFIAYKTGATIVNACAFDSIPSDLVAFTSVQTLKTLLGPDAQAGKSTSAFSLKGGFSGGTASTILTAFDAVPREELSEGTGAYALSPVKGKPISPIPPLTFSLPHLISPKPILGGYFLMSGVNSAIVRRTWGLLQSRSKPAAGSEKKGLTYGKDFQYEEFMQQKSWGMALAMSGFIYGVGILLALFKPFRWFVKNYIIPATGQGPSKDIQTNGFFRVINVTESVPTPAEPVPRYVKTVFSGKGDPGYNLGSLLVVECALLLLAPNAPKRTALGQEGGILTPMSAFGGALTARLMKTGVFELESGELVDGGRREGQKVVVCPP